MAELVLTLAIFFLLMGAILLICFNRIHRLNHKAMALSMAAFAIAAIVCLLILLLSTEVYHLPLQASPLMEELVDGFKITQPRLLLGLTAAIILLCNILFSGEQRISLKKRHLYYPLSLFAVAGLLGMIFVEDLFQKYLFLEFMSLPVYVLVAFRLHEGKSTAAGYHYMIIGSIASLCILGGFASIYFASGSLDMPQMLDRQNLYVGIGSALLLIGFLVKSGIFPGHTWVIPAYSNTPSGSSALLSAIFSQSVLFTGIEIMQRLGLLAESTGILLIVLSLLNMIVGNLLTLAKKRSKAMLAGSSIVHTGYLLFLFGIYSIYQNAAVTVVILYFILAHAFAKALSFLSLGVLYRHYDITHNEQINGIGRRAPYPALLLAFSFLSLAALPPFPLFFAKWSMLSETLRLDSPWMVAALVFLLANTLISLKYYLPQVFNIFRYDPDNRSSQPEVDLSAGFVARNWMMMSSIAILFICMVVLTISWFRLDSLPFVQVILSKGIF